MLLLDIKGLVSASDSYSSENATIEILLMLLVAFILGWLLRHFTSKDTDNGDSEWKGKYEGLHGEVGGLNNKISGLTADKSKIQKDLDACLKSKSGLKMASMAPPPNPDNLKKIEGIGPKIEQLLNSGGVYTWAGLSTTDVKFIQNILDNAGPAYKVHNPGTWPEQAKMAAEGKWNELKKWQDELMGGK